MEPHEPPSGPHRCHWYAYAVGLFVHEPVDAVNVLPCCVFPAIAGSAVLTGTATDVDEITAVAALVAVAGPAVLEAVTITLTVRPTSVIPSM